MRHNREYIATSALIYLFLKLLHINLIFSGRHIFFFFFFLITDNFIALIAVNNSLGIQLLPSIPSC